MTPTARCFVEKQSEGNSSTSIKMGLEPRKKNANVAVIKRHRHTPQQMRAKLELGEKLWRQGYDLEEVCRRLGITQSSWNRWQRRFRTVGEVEGLKAEEGQSNPRRS